MKKGTWLLLIGLVVLIGAGIGVYKWNKPHEKVEDKDAIELTATELSAAYSADENKANTQYLNKAIKVTGVVSEAKENQDGALVVFVQGDDPAMSVQCTMRDKTTPPAAGRNITLTGFCSGSTMFDVLLTDCVVNN